MYFSVGKWGKKILLLHPNFFICENLRFRKVPWWIYFKKRHKEKRERLITTQFVSQWLAYIKEVTEKARKSFIKDMILVSYKMLLCTNEL